MRFARSLCVGAVAAVLLAGATGHALAQAYPTKTVRIVVPYGPGASNDTFARALANLLTNSLGQTFIVENRPGAGGWIGTEAVSRAAPDGYTLMVNSSGVASMGVMQKTNFDASTDLTPVAMLARSSDAVIVPTSLPVTSIQELIAYARANPDKTFYGSAGIGSTNHLHGELFNIRAGTAMLHVPYKSLADVLNDLAGGRVHVMFGTIASASGMIKAGQLRLLAYGAPGRPAGTPDAPVVSEAGVPNYDAKVWWGLFAPPKLPADVLEKLNKATNAALVDESFAKFFGAAGATPAPISPAEFSAEVKKEIAEVKEVVETAKISFD